MTNYKKYPRVLLISHNAFSEESNNGKTFSNIFSQWPKDNIAQLYFKDQYPSWRICNKFYCITDEEMLIKSKRNVGRIVSFEEKIQKKDLKLSDFARKTQLPIFNTIRNILWKSKKWDNKNLYEWIENFDPQLIFLVGGPCTFIYDIANKIASEYNIPIYLYYTDDYISIEKSKDIFLNINKYFLKKTLNSILPKIPKVFVIGEDMASEYKSILGKDCIPIMNSVEIGNYDKTKTYINASDNEIIKIAYFGGLQLNRWKSIEILINTMEKLELSKIQLCVYSGYEVSPQIIKIINKPPYSMFKGGVSYQQIIEEMQKYDVLLHVESFEESIKKKTKLSISTKIPEYLASAKPILAIGPEEISSIRYLKKLDICYIIDDVDINNIETILNNLIKDRDKFKEIGLQGRKIAQLNHSLEENKRIIYEHLSREIK